MKIINPLETTEIPMEMQIDGETSTVESVAVTLESGRGFDIKFPATYRDGVVTCSIHGLDGVIELGERSLKLEAVINGKLYVPLEDTVMIAAPIKVSAKLGDSLKDVKQVAAPVAQVIKATISAPKKEQVAAPIKPKAEPTKAAPAQPAMKVFKSISANPR